MFCGECNQEIDYRPETVRFHLDGDCVKANSQFWPSCGQVIGTFVGTYSIPGSTGFTWASTGWFFYVHS